MALNPLGGLANSRSLDTAISIEDLPDEIQKAIREQSSEFNEGDLDKIDTVNEARALQRLILGLDPSVVQANPQLAQMQSLAAQNLDPALLVEMMKNDLGQRPGAQGRDLGQLGANAATGGSSSSLNRSPGGWNAGNSQSSGSPRSNGSLASSGPAQASYPAGNLDGDRAKTAMDYLQTELGITPDQAAGIVGNLAVESGGSLDPSAVGDGGNALGIAQWNGPRKAALQRFAAQQGKSATDFGVQLQFLAHELKTSESGALASLRRTNTAGDAALAFSRDFERPGIPHNDRRVAMANSAASLGSVA